uniref:Uncharacterized protein n=1 Tax=Guillardia theta TaxID=55529 RepID=A0A6U6A0P7_GUITH|mmetsp:Transcript_30009/g.96217  ORF Transcript_30009/g.96217 Transcript_30009/m.96217 type:complete len:619 (+) Transcript_30009:1579-3435(+)
MNDPDLLRSHSDLSEKLHRVMQEKNAIELKLIQETKEHEKTQALLQQQQQFLKDREAEFAAREHDLIARNERYKREKDEELEEEKSRAELEIGRAREQAKSIEVKYNLQHEIWVGEEEKFAKEIADGRQKLEKLNTQMQNVHKENARLVHEIAKVKEEAREAINQATIDCENRLSTYESALSEAKENVLRLSQEHSVVQEIESKLHAQMNCLRTELKSKEEECKTMMDSIEREQAKIVHLKESEENLRIELSNLRRQAADKQSKLERELTRLKENTMESSSKIENLEKLVEEGREKLAETMAREAEKVAEMENEISRLKAYNESLLLDHASSHTDHLPQTFEEEWKARARQQEELWSERSKTLNSANEEARQQLVRTHKSEMQAYSERLQVLEAKARDLEAACSEKDDQIAELMEAIEELEQEKRRDEIKAQNELEEERRKFFQQKRLLLLNLQDAHDKRIIALKSFIAATAHSMLTHVNSLDLSQQAFSSSGLLSADYPVTPPSSSPLLDDSLFKTAVNGGPNTPSPRSSSNERRTSLEDELFLSLSRSNGADLKAPPEAERGELSLSSPPPSRSELHAFFHQLGGRQGQLGGSPTPRSEGAEGAAAAGREEMLFIS